MSKKQTTTPVEATEITEAKVDITKLLEAQEAKFDKKMADLKAENDRLREELTNLKSNTEEENALLGEKIAKIIPEEKKNLYNPYRPDIYYNVYNEEAKVTTLMSGDEVEGIVGLQEYITKKLIAGEKEFKKFPYVVTLVEKTNK